MQDRPFRFQWWMIVALLLLIPGAAYLIYQNATLRAQLEQGSAERDLLKQREQLLQNQVDEQRSSKTQTENELAQVREKVKELQRELSFTREQLQRPQHQPEVRIIPMELSPQLSRIGNIPILTLRAETDYVALTLSIESIDFREYQVALKDPVSGKLLWKSGILKPSADKSINFGLPANLLQEQNYILELSGIADEGTAKVVSGYPFKVMTD